MKAVLFHPATWIIASIVASLSALLVYVDQNPGPYPMPSKFNPDIYLATHTGTASDVMEAQHKAKEKLEAERAKWDRQNTLVWPRTGAAVLIALVGTPAILLSLAWLWSFILARIRDVSAAVRGAPR